MVKSQRVQHLLGLGVKCRKDYRVFIKLILVFTYKEARRDVDITFKTVSI